MIVGFRGWQDKGKTALAVASIIEKLNWHGYEPGEVVGNISLKIPGTHSIKNSQMRQYLKAMLSRGDRHKIILLDEADRLFPARFWQDKAQTESLLGLWQDVKCFNQVFWTAHLGTSVDLTLRNTTQIECDPDIDLKKDCIPFICYDGLDGIVYEDCVEHVSEKVFPWYDRWEIVE